MKVSLVDSNLPPSSFPRDTMLISANPTPKWRIVLYFGLTLLVALGTIAGGIYMYVTPRDGEDCYIVNATAPPTISGLVPPSTQGFIECNCGKRCISDLGTCVSLFGFILGDNSTALGPSQLIRDETGGRPNSVRDQCTFSETSCPRGESFEDRQNAVRNAQNLAREHNHTIVPCYPKDGKLYLKDNERQRIAVGVMVVGIIVFCCWIGIACTAGITLWEQASYKSEIVIEHGVHPYDLPKAVVNETIN